MVRSYHSRALGVDCEVDLELNAETDSFRGLESANSYAGARQGKQAEGALVLV